MFSIFPLSIAGNAATKERASMRWLGRIGLMVLASGMALAQANTQNTGPSGATPTADELKALRNTMAQQHQQITQQQQELLDLERALEAKKRGTSHVEDAALHTSAPANANNVVLGDERPKESPLSFRIGGTEFTPGGFVDFENVFRSTNTTNNISTAFQAIPFSSTVPITNAVPGHLTEYRVTGQYSRWNLKITGNYGKNNVTGYIEGDFNGNNATNVYTTANANTMRLRLYWVDLKRGKWEFLGGQSWGLMTPNRVGVSPLPQDLLITYNEDANIQVGINYTRSGAFRAVWHPSDNFAWAFGIENPEQFISVATFPANSNITAQLTPQFNPTNNSNGTPNVAPDVVTKMAFDGNPGGRHMHFEVGGILTSAKATFLPSTPGGATFQHATNIGGGFQSAIVASMTKNFRMVGNLLYGSGVGRYVIGMGPQVIAVPTNFGGTCVTTGPLNLNTVNCGVALSPVHAGNALFGFELQATPKTLFGAYYGAAYFQRNTFIDVTSPTVLGIPIACAPGFPLTTHPCNGYGGLNSAQSNNRAIQEGTLDWTQTFWRNPQYGAVLLVTQYSYLTRAPWFVAAGGPRNAHLSMAFVSMRYVLP
jgi:hypothetical protein